MRCNTNVRYLLKYIDDNFLYAFGHYNRGIKHYLKLVTIRNLSRNNIESRNIKIIKISIRNINQKLIMNQL